MYSPEGGGVGCMAAPHLAALPHSRSRRTAGPMLADKVRPGSPHHADMLMSCTSPTRGLPIPFRGVHGRAGSLNMAVVLSTHGHYVAPASKCPVLGSRSQSPRPRKGPFTFPQSSRNITRLYVRANKVACRSRSIHSTGRTGRRRSCSKNNYRL